MKQIILTLVTSLLFITSALAAETKRPTIVNSVVGEEDRSATEGTTAKTQPCKECEAKTFGKHYPDLNSATKDGYDRVMPEIKISEPVKGTTGTDQGGG
jgi:hypothetical protein